jgi:hypothetical protein
LKPRSKSPRWPGRPGQIRSGGQATWQAVAMCEPLKPRNVTPARNGFAGISGVLSRSTLGEGLCRRRCLERIDGELPGVGEDGMSRRNGQRKLGSTRGLPRRSRTAKASRISRRAVKSRCACEWGGWGRLSDDGLGQHNPALSEDPRGRWGIPPYGGALSSPRPGSVRDNRC